jgi:AcrR family transcriptional regulator
VQAGLTVAHRLGLDRLTVKNVADELGITPTAVLWYVRTKAELLEAIVEVALRHLAPPERGTAPWPQELLRIFAALHHEMLANRRILNTSAFGRGAPLAFVRIGFASAQVLGDAGFGGDDLRRATQTLLRHTVGLAAVEMALDAALASPRVRSFGLRRASATLSSDDLRAYTQTLAASPSADAGDLLAFSLQRLLRGLERRHASKSRRRRA